MNQLPSSMEAHPNCAICNGPANPECPCESERLSVAVKQAEDRALQSRLYEIREWVIAQARGQIQLDFNTRVATRKATHASYLASLPYYNLYVQYSGRPPLHPPQLAQLQAQIHEASVDLRRGIDGDWRAAVLRYPDVLDYYYSLVDLRITSAGTELWSPNASQGKIKPRSRRNSDLPARSSGKRRDSRTLSIGGKPKAPPLAPLPPLATHPAAPGIQSYSRGGVYYGY